MQKRNLLLDVELSKFVNDLSTQDSVICRKIIRLIRGESLSERLFTVNKCLLPVKYIKYTKNLEGDTSVFLRYNRLLHLLYRGHLTGVAEHGADDGFPLTASDFTRLYDVFMRPNSVVLRGDYLEISKWIKGKPLRLIVRFNKK